MLERGKNLITLLPYEGNNLSHEILQFKELLLHARQYYAAHIVQDQSKCKIYMFQRQQFLYNFKMCKINFFSILFSVQSCMNIIVQVRLAKIIQVSIFYSNMQKIFH